MDPSIGFSSSPSTTPSILSTTAAGSPHHQRDSDLPPWYFPGPSSRYSARHERTRSQALLSQRSYTSIAPFLTTEARAQHRRAKSSVHVPTLRSTLLSPTPARHTRGIGLHRHSSSQSTSTLSNMSNTMARSGYDPPVTPSHHTHSSRPTSKLQDSPFSDYFTDDGRSPESSSTGSAPSPETQQLLVRLNRLQSQLMHGERENERETVAVMENKVREMEGLMDSVHAQTRLPVELEDSGLFMEEDEEDDEEEAKDTETPVAEGEFRSQMQPSEDPFSPIAEERQAEHDFLILEAQRVLGSMQKVEQNLRTRHAELRELNDRYSSHAEEVDRRLESLETETEALETDNQTLKTENEALKQDLGFDQTELLWLKMQLKTLEVEVTSSEDGARRLEVYAPELRDEIQDVKRERVAEQMRRWEVDWVDVRKRMKGRRRAYDVFALEEDEEAESEEDGDDASKGWLLSMVKNDDGELQSITITRVATDSGEAADDNDNDETADIEDDEPEEEQLSFAEHMFIIDNSPTAEPEPEDQPLSLASNLPVIETVPIDPESTPERIYSDQATPCDSRTSSWLFADEYQADHSIVPGPDDCAITTSSEDSEGYEFDDDADVGKGVVEPTKTKSAWQELWSGLSNLAGLGEEDGDGER